MTQIEIGRVSWLKDGVVIEADAWEGTPEEWESLRTRPRFLGWASVRLGSRVVAVGFPVGLDGLLPSLAGQALSRDIGG